MNAPGSTPMELAVALLVGMEQPSHAENTAAGAALAGARTALTGHDEQGAAHRVDCARAVTLLRKAQELATPVLPGQARKGSAGAERLRLLRTAQIALRLLSQAGPPPLADCTPGELDAAGELRLILDDLHAQMRPLLLVARYVASSHAVLDAINSATRHDKALEKRMFQLHQNWRDPDFDGEVLGALSELLMQGQSALHNATVSADAVFRGGER